MNNKLTRNLYRHEIACNCGCGLDTIDYEITYYFQLVCDFLYYKLGRVVIADITSGCRCPAHNEKSKGHPKSKHMEGKAIDFSIRGIDVNIVMDVCERILPIGKFYCYSPKEGVVHLQLK